MDFYHIPIGLALSANKAAMNRYSHLSEFERQPVVDRARNVCSEEEMCSLVANMANVTME